jgi:hypothetical protein
MARPLESAESALPGLESAALERVAAEARAVVEEVERILREPLGNVSRKAGQMEREAPLFFGTGENPDLFT